MVQDPSKLEAKYMIWGRVLNFQWILKRDPRTPSKKVKILPSFSALQTLSPITHEVQIRVFLPYAHNSTF